MQKIHYTILFIVITLGVASGNLLSNYASAQYLNYQMLQASQKLQRQNHIEQEKLRQVQRIEQEATEEQRRKTTKGRRLLRACEDWKSNHNKLNSAVSRSEMLKACDAYVRYITKGY